MSENHSLVGATHHITPISTYVKTLLILYVLMAATVLFYILDFGHVANNVLAMIIATIKAVLVVMFFMGVKYGTRLTQMFAILGFMWLFAMAGISLDYIGRRPDQVPGFQHEAGSALEVGGRGKLHRSPEDYNARVLTPAETESSAGK